VARTQDFYLVNGPMNGVGNATSAVRHLPRDIRSLCEIAQGVLIHRDIAPWLYELKLSGEKRDLANIRPVVRMIEEIEVGNRLLIDAASMRGRKRRCKLTPLQFFGDQFLRGRCARIWLCQSATPGLPER
jgi:hypothetical protein